MAILRNIQNNDAYEYLGGNKFVNLRTGKSGVVDDETARKIFKINIEATALIEEYPAIKDLIKTLSLKFDNNKK